MNHYRYRTFIGPILLIAIGLVALLANFGVFDAQALFRLAQLWPLILIVVGASIIINRFASPMTATSLNLGVAGVALLAVIAYAAFGPNVVGFRNNLVSRHTELSAPLLGLQNAELQLGSGASTIDVHGADLGDRLYLAKLDFEAGQQPSVTLDRESGTLTIQSQEGGHHFFFWPGRGQRHLDLTLNSGVPWNVHVGGGANSDQLDLRSLQLTGVDLSGGATNAHIVMPAAKGKVQVSVSGGANNVTLQVPAGAALRVRASGGANSVDVLGHRLSAFSGDSSYQTDNFDSATDQYLVSLEGGASNVKVIS